MALNHDIIDWQLDRDDEGHREYTVTFKIETGSDDDGPQTVLGNSQLPQVGSTWTYGGDNDDWAFCTPFVHLEPEVKEQPHNVWLATFKFVTPGRLEDQDTQRCGNTNIDNPLMEPDRISGTFTNNTIQPFKDKDDNDIVNTAFEPVKVDFDNPLAAVRIEQNRLTIDLPTVTELINKVNDSALWGLSSRKVKFSRFSWDRRLYGICTFYYVRTLEFDIDFNGFDRDDVPNECTKMIDGTWEAGAGVYTYTANGSADPADMKDYVDATDPYGNSVRYFLNKATGVPVTGNTPTYLDTVEYYQEENLLQLGIPATL